jgi:hypothetical protein
LFSFLWSNTPCVIWTCSWILWWDENIIVTLRRIWLS